MKVFDLYLSFAACFLINVKVSIQISCKDEENRDVDWFIVYKLPRIQKEQKGTYLRMGTGYVYTTSEAIKENSTEIWTLSSNSIVSRDSMLGKTWQDLKSRTEDSNIAYSFYTNGSANHKNEADTGHLKGFIAFDLKSGVWMLHSISNFGDSYSYTYPSTEKSKGQIALCITFFTQHLNAICHHLLFCGPRIFDAKMGSDFNKMLNESGKSIFAKKQQFSTKNRKKLETRLSSVEGRRFSAFAKDNKTSIDIYSEIIAPAFKTDLFVQTWRDGRGKKSSLKSTTYNVTDIEAINMTIRGRPQRIYFKSSEDYSKWAISKAEELYLVCVADLNRKKSGLKYGGGAVCFRSQAVWKAFKDIIAEPSSSKKSACQRKPSHKSTLSTVSSPASL